MAVANRSALTPPVDVAQAVSRSSDAPSAPNEPGTVSARAKLAILAVLLTTAPPVLGIPLVFPVGGGSIQFADPILPAAAFLMARGLLGRKGGGAVLVMAYAVAFLALIGLLQDAEIRWMIRDLRPLAYGVCGAAIGVQLAYAGAAVHRWAVRATAIFLGIVALLVLVTQLSPIVLVGDPADSNTVYWGSRVIELQGARTLLPTNALASLVMAGLVGAYIGAAPLRDLLGRRVAPVLFLSAATILFFSYSRNTALGIAAAVLVGLFLPIRARSAQWSKVMVGLIATVAILIPVGIVVSTTGAGQSQLEAYSERVFGGLRSDTLKVDASVRFRRDESAAAWSSIAEDPLAGKGAGVFYRPLFRNDAFQEDGGRLYSHDYWLWVLIKGGVAYLAVMLALFLWSAVRLARGRTGMGRPAEILTLCGVLGLTACSFVAPWPGEPYGAAFFFAVLSLGWVTIPRASDDATPDGPGAQKSTGRA